MAGTVSFAADARPGATLGVVSGRRRQGKSYLLQALAEALGGIYFPALELTEAVSLRLFADELVRFSGSPVPPFRDWTDAVPYLFRLIGDRAIPGRDRRVPLPGESVTRAAVDHCAGAWSRRERIGEPGPAVALRLGHVRDGRPAVRTGTAARAGRAGTSRPSVRLYRCRSLLGHLRPQAGVLVHSVVGGTPAYRREFVRDDTPDDLADFDVWVIRTALNPQTPLFREARYLLAEETEIRDPSLYHSVLQPSPRETIRPAGSQVTSAASLTRSRIRSGFSKTADC